jgi:hypothetical protein
MLKVSKNISVFKEQNFVKENTWDFGIVMNIIIFQQWDFKIN